MKIRSSSVALLVLGSIGACALNGCYDDMEPAATGAATGEQRGHGGGPHHLFTDAGSDALASDAATASDAGSGTDAATSADAASKPAPAHVSVKDYGAKGDGIADDQSALQNAFDDAQLKGVAAYVPAGVYKHSSNVTANGIVVYGDGESSVLRGADPANQTIILRGSNPALYDVKLEGVGSTRLTTAESTGVWIDQADHFTVENVHVVGAASAGIFNYSGSFGLIAHNFVEETLADSIHNTGTAHDIVVEDNRTYHSGDDGVAVVSYSPNLCEHIVVQRNTILASKFGRGLSVVGGRDVKFLSNHVDDSAGAAGLYIAAESEYNTLGVDGLVAQGNTFRNCGGTTTGHGAITIYNSVAGSTVLTNLDVRDNDVYQPLKMAVLLVGSGIESGTVQNTRVYADATHDIFVQLDANANVASVNNQRFSVTSYPGDQAAAGGGVDPSLSVP